jgi:hypothetical protein
MDKWTSGYGAMLTALGLGSYFGTGAQHKTALIPTAFGVAEIGLALLARSEQHRTNALRGAALVGALGLLGSARGLPKLKVMLEGGEVERPAAVVAQSIMAGASAIYVAVALRAMLKGR